MRNILTACLAAMLIMTGTVEAKEQGAEDAVKLEEVVVTATKTPEKRKDIPNSVIIKDRQDIQASPAKSLGELLSNELGMDWRPRGNYGGAKEEIRIRGMESNATQVFVNGVNINSLSLGDADVGKIPLGSIERIEVVKGSGSLLYGSGAMGGTINIITKRPNKDKMDLKVGAGYGTQNAYQVSAEHGMFVGGDFGYYLTAGRKETDGFRDNSTLRHNDVSLKLVLDKKDALDISLYGDFIDRDFGLPGVKPPGGTRDYYRNGIKYYNSEAASLLNKGTDRDGHIVLDVKSRPFHWLGLNAKGHYTHSAGYNYTKYESNGTGKEDWVTNKVLGLDAHVDIRPAEGATILIGGEYKDFNWETESRGLNTADLETSRTTTGAHLFTRGLFTEAQYRPSKYWKVLAGVRQEDNSLFGNAYLPLFGLVVNPMETTALKVNHGKHFLAPTPNQLYWPADSMGRGNPDLKPEIGWHTDATVEQSFLDDKLFLTATYFHWNVDDKIQWVIDTTGVSSPINLAGYKADGIEAGIRVGPYYNLTLNMNYTYLDAEEENRAYTRQDYTTPDIRYTMVKRRAAYTPDRQFKTDLTYRSGFGLTVSATARYTGDRVTYQTEKVATGSVNTKTVPYTLNDYWTVDLKIEQRLFKHWKLSLTGNNLLNKEYDTYLATFTDRSKATTDPSRTVICGYPGAGFSVFFSVGYEY